MRSSASIESRDVVYAAPIGAGTLSRRLGDGIAARRRPPARSPAAASRVRRSCRCRGRRSRRTTRPGRSRFKQWLAQNERIELMRHRETGADLAARRESEAGLPHPRAGRAARRTRRGVEPCARSTPRGRRRSPSSCGAPAGGRSAASPNSRHSRNCRRPCRWARRSLGALFGRKAFSDRHARPRDDGGARRRPDDEGSGRCAARLGKRRGASQQQIDGARRRRSREETQAIAASSTGRRCSSG